MSTLITSIFESERGNYDDMLRVFLYSARKHMPGAAIKVVREITMPSGRSNAYNAMTARLNSWVKAVEDTKGNIILCDVDLVFRADIFKVFDKFKFDIAYTGRKSHNKPINGGVVFIRDGAQGFVRTWAAVNAKMFKDIELHNKWRHKCCGMNQPAFFYLMRYKEKHGFKMLEIPCLVYNACEAEWPKMTESVQVIHLKRDLRLAVKGEGSIPMGAERAIAIWRKAEQESRSCEK